jgi:lysophosphatidate acyltransferase
MLCLNIKQKKQNMITSNLSTLHDVGKWIVLLYLVIGMSIAGVIAVIQESRIWKAKTLPSLNCVGIIKVFLFNVLWMSLCLLGSILMIIHYIISIGRADIQYISNRIVESIVSKICMKVLIGTVQVDGWENLPSDTSTTVVIPAPIYIANHASQIDIACIYSINKRFKWIAKESVLFVPGAGLLMYLGDHVPIKRFGNNGKNVQNLFKTSDNAIRSGIPMFLFPQGTRRIADSNNVQFKHGAFRLAIKNKSPLVPISIEIPTDTNPWNSTYPFNVLLGLGKFNTITPTVKLTIHKMIPIKGDEDVQALSDQCSKTIYSVLPHVYQRV